MFQCNELIVKNIDNYVLVFFGSYVLSELHVLFLKLLGRGDVSHRFLGIHRLLYISSPINQILRAVHEYLLADCVLQTGSTLLGFRLHFVPEILDLVLSHVDIVTFVRVRILDAVA